VVVPPGFEPGSGNSWGISQLKPWTNLRQAARGRPRPCYACSAGEGG